MEETKFGFSSGKLRQRKVWNGVTEKPKLERGNLNEGNLINTMPSHFSTDQKKNYIICNKMRVLLFAHSIYDKFTLLFYF